MTSEALKSRSRKILAGMAKRNGISRWHSMTKAELVRALVRITQSKAPANRVARRPASARMNQSRNGRKTAKAGRTNGAANGHSVPPRSRDLCTTEVDDRHITGRRNFIDATVCDAHWIRAQWDLTRDTIRRAETRLGTDWHTAVPALRLFEVATDDVNSVSELRVKDVLIDAGVNTWYVHVPPESRTYRLHIGYRTKAGTFFALAKSNVCSMPMLNAHLAANQTARNQSGAQHADAKEDKPDGRLGRPLGFSSLSHFGPAATEEREKGEFSFKLDTELIVHGSTRPGSMLAVQGDPVELRDDGSFTIRVNQPEGRQVIAFTALSPRGSERRMIVLGIERNTKELERQYFDGGHPEGHSE
ncbi:MAG TPA: DUF4912 domain-containing protein [Planctomycetaceae bacterium]|nr:DUF4912 domain-containing protein [Planctomycetaceae bacterium]